jgi:hypothetical protein
MAVEEQSKLAGIGSTLNGIVGPALASATTIAPTSSIHHVTGTTAIVNITPPYPGFQGTITLIPDGVLTTTIAGNLGLATTTVIGKALEMVFDGLKWYPSY